ncbi:MAG: c-type cytochrome [Betaproteobacteria bacterium]|nr:c-type cytochrome [Betaproteobacteria bacterium]
MSANIQTTFRVFRPVAALFLAAMIIGCSDTTAPGAEERIKPVARFEMEVPAGTEAPAAEAVETSEAAEAVEAAEAGEAVEAAESVEAEAVEPTAAPVTTSGQRDSVTVYAQNCRTCHEFGVAGAPKMGDKAAWSPRIATGMEALYQSSLNGKNAMPAKGGNSSFTDEEIMSAVEYMVAGSS